MKLFQLEQLLVLQKVLKIGNFIMYIIILNVKLNYKLINKTFSISLKKLLACLFMHSSFMIILEQQNIYVTYSSIIYSPQQM